jgi:hypothetical protein
LADNTVKPEIVRASEIDKALMDAPAALSGTLSVASTY